MRPCTKCTAVKPLTDYYADKKHADGHKRICKACLRAQCNQAYSPAVDIRLTFLLAALPIGPGVACRCNRPATSAAIVKLGWVVSLVPVCADHLQKTEAHCV